MSDEKWRTWWEEHADPETFLKEQRPRTVNVRQIIYEMMKSNLPPKSTILDVGCGPAVDYEPITEMGFQWVGVDMTKKFVDYVTEKYNGKADIRQADVTEKIDFSSHLFNMVYAKDLLEHLSRGQWQGVVSEMWRVTRDYMVISFFKPPDENPTDYHRVTEEENLETAGVYSNHYNRKEVLDYIKRMPDVHSVSIKENTVYRKTWVRPKGYSVWLVKKRIE